MSSKDRCEEGEPQRGLFAKWRGYNGGEGEIGLENGDMKQKTQGSWWAGR